MKKYKLVLEKIKKLDYDSKKELIKIIFNINVLVCDLSEIDEEIIIKVYDGRYYYQFCFALCEENAECLIIKKEDRIIVCKIFVRSLLERNASTEIKLEKNFFEFLKMLNSGEISYFDSFL